MKKWLVTLLVLAFIAPLSALAAEKKPINEWSVVFEVDNRKIECSLQRSNDEYPVRETNVGHLDVKISNITKITFVKEVGVCRYCEITLKNGDELKDGWIHRDNIGSLISPVYGQISIAKYPTTLHFTGHGSSTPSLASSKVDKIVLKNGDSVSGTILTDTFKLKTSYGELEFKSRDIRSINLEGGGNNVDVVVLRVGDKMSGVILNTAIKIKMTNGTEITVEKDKVKEIIFRE